MYKIVVAFSIMSVITFIIAKLCLKYNKDESNTRLWKLWGIRTAYWEGVIIVSGLITALICYTLKSVHFFKIIIF